MSQKSVTLVTIWMTFFHVIFERNILKHEIWHDARKTLITYLKINFNNKFALDSL